MDKEKKDKIETEKINFNYLLNNEDLLPSSEKAKNSIAKIQITKEEFTSILSKETTIQDLIQAQKEKVDQEKLKKAPDYGKEMLEQKIKALESAINGTVMPTITNLAGSVNGLLTSGTDPRMYTEDRQTNVSGLFFDSELGSLTKKFNWS